MHYHLMVGDPMVDQDEPRNEFMFDDFKSAKERLEEIKKNYFNEVGAEEHFDEDELHDPYEYCFTAHGCMIMLVECADNKCNEKVF